MVVIEVSADEGALFYLVFVASLFIGGGLPLFVKCQQISEYKFLSGRSSLDATPSDIRPQFSSSSNTPENRKVPLCLMARFLLEVTFYLVLRGLLIDLYWVIYTMGEEALGLLFSRRVRKKKAPMFWEFLPGWKNKFLMRHAYKYLSILYNRPVYGEPGATIKVYQRFQRFRTATRKQPYGQFQLGKLIKCINMGSYNYLGYGGCDALCTPRVLQSIKHIGISSLAARTEPHGTLQIHLDLETEISAFLYKEDAFIHAQGFGVNTLIFPAYVNGLGRECLVLSDALNHKSIVEAIRLSGAKCRAIRHNDVGHLEEVLAQTQGQYKLTVLFIEGIYSMEGHFPPLRRMVALKAKYDFQIWLDEAHSIGCVGNTGRGVCELFHVPFQLIDVHMGTFTKSFGSAGGYVAGSHEMIARIRARSAAAFHSCSMPPPQAVQALMALFILQDKMRDPHVMSGPDRITQCRHNANYLRGSLLAKGYDVLGSLDSPVIPVLIPGSGCTMYHVGEETLKRGLAIVCVGFPAVPILGERVRLCVSAAHTMDDLNQVIHIFHTLMKDRGVRIGPEVPLGDYNSPSPAEFYERSFPLPFFKDVDLLRASPTGMAPREDHLILKSEPGPPAPLNFQKKDPLNLTTRPVNYLTDSTEKALFTYGSGACSPRGFYGTSVMHLECEKVLAKFLGTEAAIIYPHGSTVVSSLIPSMVRAQDLVFASSQSGYGIQSGVQLARVLKVNWYDDMADLRAMLADISPRSNQRIWLMCEGIYRHSGQIEDVSQLVTLKQELTDQFSNQVHILIDESLSFGVLGHEGRGAVSYAGIKPCQVDFLCGSFEYAVAGVGGFLAAASHHCDYQVLFASSYTFSAAAPAYSVCHSLAVLAALMGQTSGLIQEIPQFSEGHQEVHRRLEAVRQNAQYFHEEWARRLPAHPLISSKDSFLKIRPTTLRAPWWQTYEPELLSLARITEASSSSRAAFMVSSFHSREDIQEVIQMFAQAVAAEDP